MADKIRRFESGATRDTDNSKIDFEGLLSPVVLEAFGRYMTKHRIQSDGGLRDSDNWQAGIPLDVYMKSGWRHFFSWWKSHRGLKTEEDIEDSMMALLFNLQGYAHEYLKQTKQGVTKG
jgi:hypothetical protein